MNDTLSELLIIQNITIPILPDPLPLEAILAWIIIGCIITIAAYFDHKTNYVPNRLWIPGPIIIAALAIVYPENLDPINNLLTIILIIAVLALVYYDFCGGADACALLTIILTLGILCGFGIIVIFLLVAAIALPTAVQLLDAAYNTATDKTKTAYDHFVASLSTKYRLIPVFCATFWIITVAWYILTWKL